MAGALLISCWMVGLNIFRQHAAQCVAWMVFFHVELNSSLNLCISNLVQIPEQMVYWHFKRSLKGLLHVL